MIEAPVFSSRLLAPIEPIARCGPTVVETLHQLGQRGVVGYPTARSTRSPGPPGPPAAGTPKRRPCSDPTSRSVRCARSQRSRRRRPRAPPRRKELRPQPIPRSPGPVRCAPDGQHDRDDHRSGEHDPPQRRQPVRRAVQQDERPDPGAGRHHRQHETRPQPVPDPPQLAHRDADQRRDRRCKGDGVVRMDGAVHEAEHRGGHQQPAAPQQQAGADPVGAGGLAGEPQTGDQADQRGGQQPGRLGPHRHAEHPADAGIAAEEQMACPAGPPPEPPPGRAGVWPPPPGCPHRRCAQFRCSPTPTAAGCCRWSRRCRAASRRATG